MRVLLLGLSLHPQSGGGYTFARDIFEALLRADDHQHQFYAIDSGQFPPNLPETFSRIQISQSIVTRYSDWVIHRATRRVKRLIGRGRHRPFFPKIGKAEVRKHRLDCALSLNPGEWSRLLPNICTVLDLEHRRKPYFPEISSRGEWNHRERSYRRELPRALAVITGTTTGKAQIEHFYGVDPAAVRVIPFPTPSFVLDKAKLDLLRPELPAGVTGEFLFYPAQYWAHKNHFHLLEAVQILCRDHQWNGMLVCCGSDKGNLSYLKERAAEFGIVDRVRFFGFVKQSELIALYRHAMALTFVSYFGPDNLPPLEAFALGCPVIASALEGVEEQLGTSALYVNPDSASEIARAVLRLKHEPELRGSLITAGKMRATELGPDGYAAKLIDLLDSLELRFACFRS
jgi:glycosyltransferase involved in cell wall biosynthesis